MSLKHPAGLWYWSAFYFFCRKENKVPLTPDEIEKIKQMAQRDAANDIALVRASGIALTRENAARITDPALKGAFMRQLEAQASRQARHLNREFGV